METMKLNIFEVNECSENYLVFSLSNQNNGMKINKQQVVYLNIINPGLTMKIDNLKFIYNQDIHSSNTVKNIKKNTSFAYYQNPTSIANPYQVLKEFRNILCFDQTESIIFIEYFSLSQLIFNNKKSYQDAIKKLSQDVPRTKNLPCQLNKQSSAQFQNLDLLYFISEDMQFLNQILFNQHIQIDYMLDCVLIFKVTQAITHFLKHYQQGYCDVVAIFLNLVLDSVIAQGSIIDQTNFIDFLADVAQLSMRFIQRLQANIQFFSVNSSQINNQFQIIKKLFCASVNKKEKKFRNCINQLDIDIPLLYCVEQIVSLFTRSVLIKDIFDIWQIIIADCSLTVIIDIVVSQIYHQCLCQYDKKVSWYIENVDEFFQKLKL